MKKIIIIVLILFIPLLVKADLTKEQQDDIAEFATNFITYGYKKEHLDSQGFSIHAYDQGTRNEGFYNKLAYMNNDYNRINQIRGNKWNFDCASFAAYVYYHCFGVKATGANGSPWVVSSFVNNASKSNGYFYFIGNNWNTTTMDYSRLQKGDLVVFVGSHIMVYVGDGKIAHFSSSAIKKGTNLGAEVVTLKDKYPNHKAAIIRLKNGVISTSAKANTKITWPDTGKTEDLVNKPVEVDNKPKVKLSQKTENNKTIIHIELSDDKALTGYSISTVNGTPVSWKSIKNSKTYSTTFEPEKNGTYYCYVKDSKRQIASASIKISGLDNDKPIISNVIYKYVKESNNFNLEVKATDTNKILYALDNDNYQESNIFNNVAIGEHKVYVKDSQNNIAEFSFNLSSDLIPTINLNYDTNYSKTVFVRIDGVDTQGISGYNVTRDSNEPKTFLTYSDNASYTITTNGDYYVWIKNTRGTINYQKITISNIDNTPPVITKVYVKQKNGYFNVSIDANDSECGMGAYSLNGTIYQDSNIFNDVETIYSKVFAKDKCNNVATYDIDINNIPTEDTTSGTTIILIIVIIIIVGLLGYNLLNMNKKR